MRNCPDCDLPLARINIVDRGNAMNFIGLCFTVDTPETSVWNTNKIKNQAGVVHAYLCPSCSRVLWYAAGE